MRYVIDITPQNILELNKQKHALKGPQGARMDAISKTKNKKERRGTSRRRKKEMRETRKKTKKQTQIKKQTKGEEARGRKDDIARGDVRINKKKRRIRKA